MLKQSTIVTGLSLILLISTTGAAAHTKAYEKARERFKRDLDTLQGGLMKSRDYVQFIEPHLQKAEKELAIPQHLQNKQALSDGDTAYMTALANCNVDIFRHYLNPTSSRSQMEMGYSRCERTLKGAIQVIKKADNLDVDVNAEFANTATLLTKVNKEFYKKLNILKRAILYLVTL